MTLGQDLGLVLPTFAHAVVSRAFQQALVVARVGLAEGIVFEAENPHHALRFLLQSWSERGREERGSTGKWLSACFLLLARVWGTGLILSPAPPLNSSPLGVGRSIVLRLPKVEERFRVAPFARAVVPSHFLPQEDVSKVEEMFLNKAGEP